MCVATQRRVGNKSLLWVAMILPSPWPYRLCTSVPLPRHGDGVSVQPWLINTGGWGEALSVPVVIAAAAAENIMCCEWYGGQRIAAWW